MIGKAEERKRIAVRIARKAEQASRLPVHRGNGFFVKIIKVKIMGWVQVVHGSLRGAERNHWALAIASS
jgi:hypothetical protein